MDLTTKPRARVGEAIMLRDGADGVDLWAMAAELERQFAWYKQRLADRSSDAPDVVGADDDAHGGGGNNGHGEEAEEGGGGDVRGRMYEAYVRRRDERLREGWRARMERKEAEVKALWAQLERAGRAGERAPGGGGGTTTDNGTAGEQKAEDDGEERRSSDVAPSRISGKKHERTRSFSSYTTKSSRPDVGRRRALSQEPLSSEPPAGAGDASRKDSHRARPIGVGMTAPKRKALSGNKSSAKEHGFAKTGPKPPRSLPRRSSSGGLENLKEPVLPNIFVAAPVQSCSSEEAAVTDETQKASPPRLFVRSGDGTGTANARAASSDSDCSEVVHSIAGGEAEAKNVDIEKRNAEDITVCPEKLANGEITSDSETEPSYVYIKKDVIEEEAMRRSETLAGSDAKLDFSAKKNEDDAGETMTPSVAVAAAAESATMNAEEAPARESSDDPCFSGRPGGSPPNSPPSCSSRAQSIERLLEADAALIRKKREESAEKSALMTPSSAGSRVSGTAPSPKETVRGFKRFLSFGKNRGREVTVIDCTSPSVPSLVDDDSASGGWQSTDSIKPRMGSSDAASDDMYHGYAVSPHACSLQSLVAASPEKSELNEIVPQEKSPKARRSFFSFRSLNCGRS